MEKRYIKNMNMLSKEENKKLKDFKICVIGCGGLGGYIIEMLGRLGIGYLTIVDGDTFDETNLNRQLLSDIDSLGKKKTVVAKERMKKVNPDIDIKVIPESLTELNAKKILQGHDVIVDALDNIEIRFILQSVSEKLKIPLVHGAIAGWYGQVTTILPGDKTLNKLYTKENKSGLEEELGNPSFTPALIASIEVSEVLKLLLKKGDLLRNKLLYVNTLDNEYEIIQFE